MRWWMVLAMVAGCGEPKLQSLCAQPFDNQWVSDGFKVAPDEIGWEVGSVPPDLQAVDQFGDETCLWQFAGQPVWIEVATMWAQPARGIDVACRAAYFGDEVVHLTVLTEGTIAGTEVTQDDAALWAEALELDQGVGQTPVVTDPGWTWASEGFANSVPQFALLGWDLQIVERVEGEIGATVTTDALADLLGADAPDCDAR